MWVEAGAEEACKSGVPRRYTGFPDAQSAGRVAGSCGMSRGLPGEQRVWREAPIIESSGSDLNCPLKSLGSLKKYERLGPLSGEPWIS